MSYEKPLKAALADAAMELQDAARAAGIIDPLERIKYIEGSRAQEKAPIVIVQTPQVRAHRFDLVPEFNPSTRGREVAVAMTTAALMLRRLVDAGVLPADL